MLGIKMFTFYLPKVTASSGALRLLLLLPLTIPFCLSLVNTVVPLVSYPNHVPEGVLHRNAGQRALRVVVLAGLAPFLQVVPSVGSQEVVQQEVLVQELQRVPGKERQVRYLKKKSPIKRYAMSQP